MPEKEKGENGWPSKTSALLSVSLPLSLSLSLSVIVASLLPRVDALALHSPVRDLVGDLGSGDGDLAMKYVGLPRVLKRSV